MVLDMKYYKHVIPTELIIGDGFVCLPPSLTCGRSLAGTSPEMLRDKLWRTLFEMVLLDSNHLPLAG